MVLFLARTTSGKQKEEIYQSYTDTTALQLLLLFIMLPLCKVNQDLLAVYVCTLRLISNIFADAATIKLR